MLANLACAPGMLLLVADRFVIWDLIVESAFWVVVLGAAVLALTIPLWALGYGWRFLPRPVFFCVVAAVALAIARPSILQLARWVGATAPFLLVGGTILVFGYLGSWDLPPEEKARSRHRTWIWAWVVVAGMAALVIAGARASP